MIDRAALATAALALMVWAYDPDLAIAPWLELAAGAAISLRLARWRGRATVREPLVAILHIAYGWLALGFVLLAASRLVQILPPTTALHALTTGAIGTMTLAVMTRASLGHTGRPLVAGRGTITIYLLISAAAVLRLIAPIDQHITFSCLALLARHGAAHSYCSWFHTEERSRSLGLEMEAVNQSERGQPI